MSGFSGLHNYANTYLKQYSKMQSTEKQIPNWILTGPVDVWTVLYYPTLLDIFDFWAEVMIRVLGHHVQNKKQTTWYSFIRAGGSRQHLPAACRLCSAKKLNILHSSWQQQHARLLAKMIIPTMSLFKTLLVIQCCVSSHTVFLKIIQRTRAE